MVVEVCPLTRVPPLIAGRISRLPCGPSNNRLGAGVFPSGGGLWFTPHDPLRNLPRDWADLEAASLGAKAQEKATSEK